jgi:uronate dehydrogenase
MTVTALITGGAGEIATLARPLLRERGWRLRLLDTSPPAAPLHDDETHVAASILDEDALERAARGADVVIHLAAFRRERPWADILSVNIDGTRAVLAAAERAGVRRVLLASSVHAVGFAEPDAVAAQEVALPRPDTYYGVSKAAMEALGSLYADQYGMSVVSARIVNATAAPQNPVGRVCWFSPGDAARLFAATAALDRPGHHVVWGISAGGASRFPLAAGRRIGYEPEDDATLPGDLEGMVASTADAPLGGAFASWPLGEPMD